MPWNPEVYHQFKAIREQPFYDLVNLLQDAPQLKGVDLGCGTGEQTAFLAARFQDANFLGIDASAEMLEQSKRLVNEHLQFEQTTTEALIRTGQKWDLIFSNAALQWSDDHELLFPQLIALLTPGGQFAVQMPVQQENLLNRILMSVVAAAPFHTYLQGWKRSSPVLSMDQYAEILFRSGLEDLQVLQKVYPIIADDYDTLLQFISGSALIPYMDRLTASQKKELLTTYKASIAREMPQLPALYPFKRLLLYGRKAKP